MKQKILFVLAVITLLTGMSMAVQRHWISTGSTDWFTASNWNAAGIPGVGDTPRLGVNDAKGIPTVWPVYNGDNSTNPTDGAFLIGKVRNAQFTMQSGTMVHNSWVNIGNGGVGIMGEWFHNGGEFDNRTAGTQFTVGDTSVGYLEMNDGLLQAGLFRVSGNNGGTGSVVMNGGEILSNEVQIGIVNAGLVTINNGDFITTDNDGGTGDMYVSNASSIILNGGEIDVDDELFMDSGSSVQINTGAKIETDKLVFNDSASSIDLAGGTMKFRSSSMQPLVDDMISSGLLVTSIPDYFVVWELDEDNDVIVYASDVPEPATLALIGIGGMLLRKRK